MSEQPRIHIDLPAIEGKLGTGIRRVAAFMAIGLNASRTVTAGALVLDHTETMFRFFSEEPGAEVLDEAGREFRMWIQANGLRELCSFLEQYLSDIYLAAAWIKLSDGGKVASGTNVPELPKDFVRKGLGTKLALLERDFGITAPHGEILSTFWDARNCLTHRLGFVGEADLTAGDALVVKWIGWKAGYFWKARSHNSFHWTLAKVSILAQAGHLKSEPSQGRKPSASVSASTWMPMSFRKYSLAPSRNAQP